MPLVKELSIGNIVNIATKGYKEKQEAKKLNEEVKATKQAVEIYNIQTNATDMVDIEGKSKHKHDSEELQRMIDAVTKSYDEQLQKTSKGE